MPKVYYLFLLLILPLCTYSQNAILTRYCTEFDKLNTEVTNGSINREKAEQKFKKLITRIKAASPSLRELKWKFPLAGYTSRDIGGNNGNGYHDKGYNYFDGNKHTAHPAHDIFINDRNQDDMDDATQAPVDVLAVADGIVLACSNHWDVNSNLRGGKYIWLYHPQQNVITYYAHNHNIFVKPGNLIKQAQKIAEVGRTGLNAHQKRSPTHLHFSAFYLVNNLPVSYNPYTDLTHL